VSPVVLPRLTPAGTLGRRFWLIVLASTFASLANGAVTPLLPGYVAGVLHGDAVATGALVGIAPFVGVLSQPAVGWLADHRGYRLTWILSALIGVAGILAMLGTGTFAVAALSRSLFGIATNAANTIMAAWVIATVVPHERGRGLGLFGVSIWIGLGAGPQLGQAVVDHAGYAGLWVLSGVLMLAALLIALPLANPRTEHTEPNEHTEPAGQTEPAEHTEPAGQTRLTEHTALTELPASEVLGRRTQIRLWTAVLRSVAVPGTVAGLAWSAEGVILAFLIVHLQKQGFDTGGLYAPASVLTVFATSVIIARFLISSVTDRLGPRRTAGSALVLLTFALVLLAVARSFPVAALAAVMLGFAYAPLYPALTLLANEHLTARNRATGLGLFSALTAVGTTVGTGYGGLLSNWSGEESAFLAAAGLQVVALAVLLGRRGLGRGSRVTTPQRGFQPVE
jgi:MFS family permease